LAAVFSRFRLTNGVHNTENIQLKHRNMITVVN